MGLRTLLEVRLSQCHFRVDSHSIGILTQDIHHLPTIGFFVKINLKPQI